ncbi:transposase [candidate division CSSED10-310 bacterium]|uniref:Transposase n=1 Tax=candidate division CSSED10-310 bacterium TaxID=2855610 RepID=A0ABV6Z6Q4_UNCC1
MQRFLTSYSMTLNRKQGGYGHIFQGRFKSILVESGLYRSELSRYIHLNPVRIRTMKKKSIEWKRDYLKTFRWSSYRIMIGLDKKPAYVNRRYVLSPWGNVMAEKMRKYRYYVEEGLRTEVEDPLQYVVGQSILGSETFIERIKEKISITQGSG